MRCAPIERKADAPAILDFLSGRSASSPLPPYWSAGRSALGTYLDLFMGPETDHIMWKDGVGTIVAYACVCPPDDSRPEWVAPPNSWALLAHPEDRNDDLLDAVATHAETTLGARAASRILTSAYESDGVMTGRLDRRGYSRDVYLGPYMARPLDGPLPTGDVPSGYVVRPFLPDSELVERARAAADSFGGMADAPPWLIDSVRRMVEFRESRGLGETDVVAVTEDGVIAAHAAVVLDSVTRIGELEGVGTRRAHVRQGLARAVVVAGLRHMRASGMRQAVVRTDADREPAVRLYGSVGFRAVDRLYRYVKGGASA